MQRRFPGFWGRMKFYLLGLAIGCALMGFFQMAKKNEGRQAEAAAERARQEQLNNPNTLFPPLPEAQRAKAPGQASDDATGQSGAPAPKPVETH